MIEKTLKEPDLPQKIIRNTAYNALGRFWGILVALFLTPYIIHRIGSERFGIWAIVGVITGYFGLLDFGIGSSFVKYIVEFYTKKELDKINQLINTGFVFYSFLAIIIAILAFFLVNPLLSLFKIPAYLHDEAAFVVFVGIFLFAGANAFSIFYAVQTGLQRMDISNKAAIAVSLPNIIGTVFFLKKGYGLPGLMINNVMIFIMQTIINICIAHTILPELKFNPFAFNKKMFNRLFKFGFRVQIAKISGVVTGQTDKILIAYFLSIGLVTFYQLGNSVVYYVISICGLLVSALMPAFSEIEARGERNKLADAYLMTTKYLTFFVAPLFVFLVISASDIIAVWMGQGQGYEKSGLVLQLLAMGYALNTIAQIGSSTSVAIDKPQLMATGSIIIILLNIVLSIIFVKLFGFLGVAWGTLLSVNIGTIYFLVRLHKVLHIPLVKLMRNIVPYFVISIISACAVYPTVTAAVQLGGTFSRATVLGILFIRGLFFLCVYITVVYFGRFIDAADIDFFRKKFSFVRRLRVFAKYAE